MHYLREFHKLVITLYERLMINVRLAHAGLQPRVYWINAKSLPFLEPDYCHSFLMDLTVETGFFHEAIYDWMQNYFVLERDMFAGAVFGDGGSSRL
jgi:hypothetical protein